MNSNPNGSASFAPYVAILENPGINWWVLRYRQEVSTAPKRALNGYWMRSSNVLGISRVQMKQGLRSISPHWYWIAVPTWGPCLR